MSLRRLADPKNDVVFKLLFSSGPDSEEALRSLLTAVLRPPLPLKKVQVLDPGLPAGRPLHRSVILDVVATLDDGTQVDVEMQTWKHPAFRERALYYWARLFTRLLKRGERYDRLRHAISVLFLDYDEFEGGRWHSTFRPLEIHTGEVFSSAMEIHAIELGKLPASEQGGGEEAPLWRWSRFLKAETDEEVEALAMQDPGMRKARKVLRLLSKNEDVRRQAEARERYLATKQIYAEGEWRAGRAAGLEEGRAEGLRQAITLLCQVRGTPMDVAKRAWLESAPLEALEAELERLGREAGLG